MITNESMEELNARWRREFPDLYANLEAATSIEALHAALDDLREAEDTAHWERCARRGVWVEGIGPFRFRSGPECQAWIRQLSAEANNRCPSCNSDSPEFHPGSSINGPCPDRWHVVNAVIEVDEAGPGLVPTPYADALAAIEWGMPFVTRNELGYSYGQVLTEAEARRHFGVDDDEPVTPGGFYEDPLVPAWSFSSDRRRPRFGPVHVENVVRLTDEQFRAARWAGWVLEP